jgi:hypothetical protein
MSRVPEMEAKARGIGRRACAGVIAALVIGAALAATAVPAEARFGGGFGGGFGMRGGGFRMGGFQSGFGPRRFIVRRAAFGRPFFVNRRFAFRHHRVFVGPFAAGFAGGVALGALGYSAGDYGYSGYGPADYGGDNCFTAAQRLVDPWGRVVIRPVLVCY